MIERGLPSFFDIISPKVLAQSKAAMSKKVNSKGNAVLKSSDPRASLEVSSKKVNTKVIVQKQPMQPCRFFAQGSCKFGSKCHMSHNSNDVLSLKTLAINESLSDDDDDDNDTYIWEKLL
jgi:hypothetical protein